MNHIERERSQPVYEKITFESVQRVVEKMTGQQPQNWQELYQAPWVVVTPNIDLAHLQKIGVTHYLWDYGWHNIDRIELDIRGDGRIAPPFTERKAGYLSVFRHSESEQIVEVDMSYEIPDVNERGFKEQMDIILRRFKDEQGYRLILRSVGEYDFFVEGLGLINHQGGGVGLDSKSEGWNKPRYAAAFKEMLGLLGVYPSE